MQYCFLRKQMSCTIRTFYSMHIFFLFVCTLESGVLVSLSHLNVSAHFPLICILSIAMCVGLRCWLFFALLAIELIIIIERLYKGDVSIFLCCKCASTRCHLWLHQSKRQQHRSSIERILKFQTLIDRFIIIVTKSAAKIQHPMKMLKKWSSSHSMSSTMFR